MSKGSQAGRGARDSRGRKGQGATGRNQGRQGQGSGHRDGGFRKGGRGPYQQPPRQRRGGSHGGHGRSASGVSRVEGRRAAIEALEGGVPIRRALLQERQGGQDRALDDIVRRLEDAGVPMERVPRARLDALSSHGAHQGVMLECEPFRYADLDEILERAGDGDALVVLLDHVTDEGNFGAIIRSAEVVGAAGVIIANARAASVGVAAYKTSAGAALHLPIAQVPNLARALEQLKEAGFWTCAASEHAAQTAWEAPLEGRLCLVMGSEGSGVSQLLLKKCDFTCRLPQRGRVESLNVAQAATVFCYEWLRRESAKEAAAADGAAGEGE